MDLDIKLFTTEVNMNREHMDVETDFLQRSLGSKGWAIGGKSINQIKNFIAVALFYNGIGMSNKLYFNLLKHTFTFQHQFHSLKTL